MPYRLGNDCHRVVTPEPLVVVSSSDSQPAVYPPLVSATVGYIITSQCIPSFCLCHSWLHRSQLLRTFLWSVPQLVTAVYPPLVSGSWLHHNPPLVLLPISFLCDHFISLLITMHLYCCMCILTDVRGNVGCLKFPFFKCLCPAACNHFYWGLVLVYSNLVLIFYALLHPLPPPVPIVFISQV